MFGFDKVKFSVALVGLVFGLVPGAEAMDRWSALSLLESGNDDAAVGSAGEVSRFQIKPQIWRRYAPAQADWRNPGAAAAVARQAMQDRCAAFERSAHRQPTDFEFYVLWNAPAQIQSPGRAVSARAKRFCNLVNCR